MNLDEMRRLFAVLMAMSLLAAAVGCTGQYRGKRAADAVIDSFVGDGDIKVRTRLVSADGNPGYRATAKNGVVTIEGNTPVAITKGFYDIMRESGAGIESWSGSRFDAARLKSADLVVEAVSPFRNHYRHNVVTYGYSMPYWDAARWDREIDDMALHGYDMPLMLIAQEAITMRVLLKEGLTEEEVNDYFVGPAHLPWMRMGNISGIDGPLDNEWHKGQLRLAHHVMDRMKALGMTPICPGFSGFVPKAIKRVHPEVDLVETSWCDGAFHNWMVSPDQPLFKKLGSSFVEEWEKEFGKCSHFLVDSFNELDIPFAPHGDPARYEQLAGYGRAVYESIAEADPDAVWVMQGWMFGYQRDIWDEASLKALLQYVPDEKMLLLDLAVDYNYLFWHSEVNWEFYDGFFGKPWVYSVIPNMGGKNSYAGYIDFYANQGRLDALSSPRKGKLAAYGYAAEGIESNELIYELYSDAGWTSDPIDVDAWLTRYQQCRYGGQIVPNECWKAIYNSFTDHPAFFWQKRPGLAWEGSVTAAKESQDWLDAVHLNDEPLARADYAEVYAEAKGAEVERLLLEADRLISDGRKEEGEASAREAFDLMTDIDARLAADFPSRSLAAWVDYARAWGQTPEMKDRYAANAMRIVTVWGPPVDDYSCRLWSGLISGYYLPRWRLWLQLRLEGKDADEIDQAISEWELKWLRTESCTAPENEQFIRALADFKNTGDDASLQRAEELAAGMEAAPADGALASALVQLYEIDGEKSRLEAAESMLNALGENPKATEEARKVYRRATCHPRLIMDDKAFDDMKSQIENGTNPPLAKIHALLMEFTDAYGEVAFTKEYDESHKRILGVSRSALAYITNNAYAYRYTGERKYFDAAARAMDEVCSFDDWNPSHFLDVAEMAAGVAIGYDWLWNDLSPELRAKVEKCLKEYAIEASRDEDDAWFYNSMANWNQVCNAGLTLSAIAIREICGPESGHLIVKAIENNRPVVEAIYSPDGNYREGQMYWDYGTCFQAMLNTTLQSALGADFGLADVEGFSKTAEYKLFCNGASHKTFNYYDNNDRELSSGAMWYFASRFNRPDLLATELLLLEQGRTVTDNSRVMPFVMAWAAQCKAAGVREADRGHMYVSNKSNPVVLVRGDWTCSEDDFYLGMKGGSGSDPHAHLDAGNFVFDAFGERWASDYGMVGYAEQEARLKQTGGDFWDMSQNSQRWDVVPLGNEWHNTLTVNGKRHNVNGRGVLLEAIDEPGRQGGVIDLTTIFPDLTGAVRTVTTDGRGLVVTDCLSTDKPAQVRWTLVTPATCAVGTDGVLLTNNGKEMHLAMTGAECVWSLRETDNPVVRKFNVLDADFTIPAGQTTVTFSLKK